MGRKTLIIPMHALRAMYVFEELELICAMHHVDFKGVF